MLSLQSTCSCGSASELRRASPFEVDATAPATSAVEIIAKSNGVGDQLTTYDPWSLFDFEELAAAYAPLNVSRMSYVKTWFDPE